jgi:hypothetical protein
MNYTRRNSGMMNTMRHVTMARIWIALGILALIFGLWLAAHPPYAEASCSNAKITFYEDPHQGSDGTDPLLVCYNTAISYMGNVPAYPDGDCKALLLNHPNWNDCASSWTFWASISGGCAHYGVNLYRDSNYSVLLWSAWGQAGYSGGAIEDTISSMKFKYRATCPTAPVQEGKS